MSKKVADLLFLVAIVLILTAGLVTALLFPNEIDAYENRYANRMPALTAEGYLDGSFQRGVDDTLSDQVNFSTAYKRTFHTVQTATLLPAALRLSAKHPDRYVNYQGIGLFGGDYFVHSPRPLYESARALETRAANYNETFARLPDTEFYLYYIESDVSVDFETGEQTMAYEYLRERLNLPADHMDCFAVDGFDDFAPYFYHTDHHWNHAGSYQGYLEVLDLLGAEDEPLVPLEEAALPGEMVGSKAREAGATGVGEPVSLYRFDFPETACLLNGREAEDYGTQTRFPGGSSDALSYGAVYGGDDGEVVLSGGKPGGGVSC